MPVHRGRALVRKPEDHHARAVQNAKGEDLTEIEVKGQYKAGVNASPLDDLAIWCAVQADVANMRDLIAQASEELNRLSDIPASARNRTAAQACRGWS